MPKTPLHSRRQSISGVSPFGLKPNDQGSPQFYPVGMPVFRVPRFERVQIYGRIAFFRGAKGTTVAPPFGGTPLLFFCPYVRQAPGRIGTSPEAAAQVPGRLWFRRRLPRRVPAFFPVRRQCCLPAMWRGAGMPSPGGLPAATGARGRGRAEPRQAMPGPPA